MSLIEEALRRAQQTPPAAEASGGGSTQTLELDPPPLFSKSDAGSSAETVSGLPFQSWVGLLVVVVATVMLTLWVARPFVGAKPSSTPPVAANPAATEAPRAAVAPLATASQPSLPTATAPAIAKPALAVPSARRNTKPLLALNGVVEGSGEPLAIINGSILQVGETVEGATLLEVKKDTAKLRWHDQEIVIRTTR